MPILWAYGDIVPISINYTKVHNMKIAFIPKASYTIGQIITVHGEPMRVESYAHTGKNVTVCTLPGANRFKRMVCICTDAPAIEGITA